VGIVTAVLAGVGVLVFAGTGTLALAFRAEGVPRAMRLTLLLGGTLSLGLLTAALAPPAVQRIVVAGLALVAVAGLVAFFLPVGRGAPEHKAPSERIDERDIMFARARLEPGTPEYKAYYGMRPEKKAGDDRTRALPGLLSPAARAYHPAVFAAISGTFDLIDALRDQVRGPVATEHLDLEPQAATAYVKGLARYWGARAAGVTRVRPYHVYSHIGRGPGPYGVAIHLDHAYALAFTVAMDRGMVATAPAAPTLLESAHQYANAAQIAILLASAIRAIGYDARAHVDGNYRVVAPLVAWDAGLGEFGRMGLLMTPDLGPRVRLGVVTTDLPLVPDGRRPDLSMVDFCRICLKCAENCPARAIPFGDRQEIEGTHRWRIDQERCYRYWCIVGTDCARCVAVCPYSYPDTAMHNLVRRAIRYSGTARRAVHRLDRLFYGTRPRPTPVPGWLPPEYPSPSEASTRRHG
jgi:ferredoxin